MWLKRTAVIQEGEQGCVLCKHYDRWIEDPYLRCKIGEQVINVHGGYKLIMWVDHPTSPNDCSFFEPNPDPNTKVNYRMEEWQKSHMGVQHMWLNKKAEEEKVVINMDKPLIMENVEMHKSKIKVKEKNESAGPVDGCSHKILTWLKKAEDRQEEIKNRDIELEQAAVDEYRGQMEDANPELAKVLDHLIDEEREHKEHLEEGKLDPTHS